MQGPTEYADHVRVLVVEDEFLVALSLEDALDEIGYRYCGVAATADEALSAAKSERPAIALVDIGLRGGGDGVTFARESRDLS